MFKLQEIGVINSNFKEPADPEEMRKEQSSITIKPEFAEGLYLIEDNTYLQVIFYLHRSEGYQLKGARRHGRVRGVFASRSPKRPNPIAVTTVKLLERKDNVLLVEGLDAIDGTPLIDIKPYSPIIDDFHSENEANLKANPRSRVNKLIYSNNLEELLLKSGELHGHFCPGLALGVKAATYGVNYLNLQSEGMEDVLAIVETNSCFSDGVQYVAGCTFGNNALIYRDYGKTAVTITDRKKNGVRLYAKNNNFIKKNYPEASQLFTKVIAERKGTDKDKMLLSKMWREISFKIIKLPIEELFTIKELNPEIPDYAPIFADEFCSKCGEKIMAPKAIHKDNKIYCKDCAGSSYLQLDGSGLLQIN